MHTLSLNFTILQFCGLWRPLMWSSGWKCTLYDCYSFAMTFLYYMFAFSQIVALFESLESVEEFTQASFLLPTVLGVCLKTINVLINRKQIIDFTNILKNDFFGPRNTDENNILIEYEREARFTTMWYCALGGITVSLMTLRSFIFDIPQRDIPFKAWFPFHLDLSLVGYWIAFSHQNLCTVLGAAINSSYDTLVAGLLMHTRAQMKILKYRLEAMPRTIETRKNTFPNVCNQENKRINQSLESELVAECIKHHVEIFDYAATLNDVFGLTIFLQFAQSSLVLCVSVYEVSTMKLFSPQFISIMLYLSCMLVQIYIYCFYGGELMIESVHICEAVYQLDWFALEISTKKSLITIMTRSLRPITFTCGSIITLSLDSFNSLVKLSYSAYNALQRFSE